MFAADLHTSQGEGSLMDNEGEFFSYPSILLIREESVDHGVTGAYTYNHQKNMLCTMVALSQDNAEAGHEIAMQIAASAPLALTSEDLDPTLIAKERVVAEDKAREEGKPEAMIAMLKRSKTEM